MAFLLNHLYKFDIDLGKGSATPKWTRIARGISSLDPDNNEESEENAYFDGGGASERDVIGFMMSYGFEGHRDYKDEAQNYIMRLANQTGEARKIPFRVTEPDGGIFEGRATISDIKVPGGDAVSKGEIEFTISFDGVPEYTEPVAP
ncbi:phage tail tube protein [Bacillus mycoides]|uniref:phage tail tube protein n=1 Tax=Bacillus mycoides TaxID=1405 RepID=UPI001C017393|nr:capsid protein [Bacillus mycoides]QWI52521.1 capsid protein [Bacillus mycoides]